MTPYVILTSLILLLSHQAHSIERELTVNVEPRREDCFYEIVKQSDTIELDYQVIDGEHGDLDINFRLVDPTGRILLGDYKKSENTHQVTATTSGDYRFCFDNTFSSYNTKTVFFELSIGPVHDTEWGSDENFNFDGITASQVFDAKVEDVNEIVNGVRNSLNKVQHLQDLIKSTEARDRNIAEENNFKVTTYSLFQLVLMLAVGTIQVVMVKSLFDEHSRVHRIWKNLNQR
ncbi:hypothetical protein NQ315_015449 [Exocentrus adspersus]|uniref:GOLD domain-containing protein n=1 Tax=Exocentrus adspersus TaxID=1586481 RepID=A0AAV8VLJ9_9CUCU|nr:hypothetical protein NQ315_015449 [Exocentrus adspersus]